MISTRPPFRADAYRSTLRTVVAAVRASGAADALAGLRFERPRFTDLGYHDTAAVYLVWAVDRLVRAGLDDIAIAWHPLVQLRSMRQWWDADTIASAAARHAFVAPTRCLPGDPVPAEPGELVAV